MAIYFWNINDSRRAGFIPKDEEWKLAVRGLQPFPGDSVDQLVLEELTGSDVPEVGVLPLVDLVFLAGQCRLLSPRAKDVLGPDLSACGEFHRVRLREAEYWLFHPTLVVDCLDKEATRAYRVEDEMVVIYDPVFIEHRLPEQLAFLAQGCKNSLFVHERFKELVKKAKLKGAWLYVDDDDKGWKT